MSYIGPRGISLDAWNSWSDYAQSAALAWQSREAASCPNGHHVDQWDPQFGGDLMHHVQLKSHVCPACEHMERQARAQEREGERWPGEYVVWEPLAAEDRDDEHHGDDGDHPGGAEQDHS